MYYSYKKSDICAQGKSIKAVIINIQNIVVWLDSIILKINREMPTKLSTRVGLWSIFSFIFIHARMGRSSSIVDTPSGKGFESYIMPNFVQIHEQNAGRRTTRSGTTAMNWTLLKDLQYELKFVRKKM